MLSAIDWTVDAAKTRSINDDATFILGSSTSLSSLAAQKRVCVPNLDGVPILEFILGRGKEGRYWCDSRGDI